MASPIAWTDATRERTISRRLDCVGRQLMFLPVRLTTAKASSSDLAQSPGVEPSQGTNVPRTFRARAPGKDDHFIAVGKQAAGKGLAHEPAAASQNDPFGSHEMCSFEG